MNTERLKGWLSSSSKLVAASAQLAKKQAELATLNNVTLPRLYHAIGKRLIGSSKLPPDLVPHREKIRDLEAAIAKTPEKPAAEPASGFAAKAKHLAQQAASKTAKATADAAATVKIQAAYVALGKQAIAKYGPQALPTDFREQYEAGIQKQSDLGSEITALKGDSGKGFVTPGRLAVFGSVACLLLGLWALGGVAGWVFSSPSYIPIVVDSQREQARARAEPHTHQSPSADTEDDDETGTAESALAAADHDSGRAGTTDPAVAAVIGDTSHHYTTFGYKDVVLGTTFEQIDTTYPIRFAEPGGYAFVEKPGSPHTFFFDADGRLVCYQITYKGDADDYLNELVQVFGKTDKRLDTRSFRMSSSASEISTIRYAFPRTLVFVEFGATQTVSFRSANTVVTVLDRRYVEDLLIESATGRRTAINWMTVAAQRLKEKTFSGDQVPPLEGCRIDAFETRIEKGAYVIDTTYEKVAPKQLFGIGKKGSVAKVSLSLVDVPNVHSSVYFQLKSYTPACVERLLKQGNTEGKRNEPARSIVCLPYLQRLRTETTACILQEHFPPAEGKMQFVQHTRFGVMLASGSYEWQHHEADGSKWTIQCGENDDIQLTYKPPKRL